MGNKNEKSEIRTKEKGTLYAAVPPAVCTVVSTVPIQYKQWWGLTIQNAGSVMAGSFPEAAAFATAS